MLTYPGNRGTTTGGQKYHFAPVTVRAVRVREIKYAIDIRIRTVRFVQQSKLIIDYRSGSKGSGGHTRPIQKSGPCGPQMQCQMVAWCNMSVLVIVFVLNINIDIDIEFDFV